MSDRADEWKKIAIGLMEAIDLLEFQFGKYYLPDIAVRDHNLVIAKMKAFEQKLAQEQINEDK